MESGIQKITPSGLTACSGCDLLLKQLEIEPGLALFCPRCGKKLQAPKKNSVAKTLACSIAALVLYPPAAFMPLMTLELLAIKKSASIVDGVISLYDQGYLLLSLLVLLTSLLFPLAKLLLIFIISVNLKLNRYPASLPLLMRAFRCLDEWGMLEVYLIGILVALIKMYNLADIHYGAGLFCFIGLLIVSICASTSMDEHLFWNLIEKKGEKNYFQYRPS